MAARRSNKRKRRNRGRFGILYQFLSLVIILVVIAAGCVVFFRVDEVTVDGESKYTAEEIIAASGIEQGDNLFLISPVQTGRKIASVLPYVDNVNVRRALPDGVVITVTECMPAAVIQGNGSWWIIDAKGKVLEQTASGTGAAVVSGLTALLRGDPAGRGGCRQRQTEQLAPAPSGVQRPGDGGEGLLHRPHFHRKYHPGVRRALYSEDPDESGELCPESAGVGRDGGTAPDQ